MSGSTMHMLPLMAVGVAGGAAFTVIYALLAPLFFKRLSPRVARTSVLELGPIFVLGGVFIAVGSRTGVDFWGGFTPLLMTVLSVVLMMAIYWAMGLIPAVRENRAEMAKAYPAMKHSAYAKLFENRSQKANSKEPLK